LGEGNLNYRCENELIEGVDVRNLNIVVFACLVVFEFGTGSTRA